MTNAWTYHTFYAGFDEIRTANEGRATSTTVSALSTDMWSYEVFEGCIFPFAEGFDFGIAYGFC